MEDDDEELLDSPPPVAAAAAAMQDDDDEDLLRTEMQEDMEMEDVEDDGDDEDSDEDLEDAAGHHHPPTSSHSSAAPSTEEDAALVRRRAIQAIMRDTQLSGQEKAVRIQQLMSGNRTSVAPAPAPILASSTNTACVHYERNCHIVAPCCNKVFGCRICHDELSPAGHAPMNRFLVQEVVCKNCTTRQPASNHCGHCQTVFGEYHCQTCNLWMSRAKKPFHCDKCGFCRVGGMEAFRHCDECCMCISVSVFDTHQCFKDKYKNNCPVCREDMFSSRQSPQDLPCGHAIHAHCFRKLAGFDYRCPICKKTVVSQQSMAAAWEARARDIAEHPMPADLLRVVDIMCNDCETKSNARQWHFLGIQCPGCSSFNTVVEQVLSTGGSGEDANNASNNDSDVHSPGSSA